ncbi:MAG: hypothetical protein E6J43_02720 [Chloroflexi bacterium]|nr:MAG: hypothetical protein E6J43_02720 [Chloroflexota bacterium]
MLDGVTGGQNGVGEPLAVGDGPNVAVAVADGVPQHGSVAPNVGVAVGVAVGVGVSVAVGVAVAVAVAVDVGLTAWPSAGSGPLAVMAKAARKAVTVAAISPGARSLPCGIAHPPSGRPFKDSRRQYNAATRTVKRSRASRMLLAASPFAHRLRSSRRSQSSGQLQTAQAQCRTSCGLPVPSIAAPRRTRTSRQRSGLSPGG